MSMGHREFLKICKDCGQIYDVNIPSESVHHTQLDHAPLPRQREQSRYPRLVLVSAK